MKDYYFYIKMIASEILGSWNGKTWKGPDLSASPPQPQNS